MAVSTIVSKLLSGAIVATGGATGLFGATMMAKTQSIYTEYTAELENAYANAKGINVSSITSADRGLIVDAVRHTYASAVLSNAFGEERAQIFNLWEWKPQIFTPMGVDNSNMDYWNNSVGRAIGQSATDHDDIVQRIITAMGNGDLIVSPYDDPREYDDSLLLDISNVMQQGAMYLSDVFTAEDLQETVEYLQIDSGDNTTISLATDISNLLSAQNAARVPVIQRCDPLILDLDGDGVELLSVANGVYWDLDEDGFTRLAVFDTDLNGVINANDNFEEDFQITKFAI